MRLQPVLILRTGFFERIKSVDLKNTIIAAFGSTRRRGISPSEDGNLQALLSADTKTVAVFGKSWDFHVTDIINAALQENLEMIYDTIAYLKEMAKRIVFDALNISLTATKVMPNML